MPEPDPEKLVSSLRRAAYGLTDDRSIRDMERVVSKLVQAAVDTIAGVDGGGISRTEQGTVRSTHASAEDILRLDQLQSELGEGPCITAADDPPGSGLVIAEDLAGADAGRWPSFAPAAVRAGYRSLMSVALSMAGKRRSALNLYAREPGVFDKSAQLTAGLFGVQAAMLLHGADHAALLGQAVESRDVIGQAKGILMERFTVDDDGAFRMLVESSQDTNVKLVDVARWLTGEVSERFAQATARNDSRSGDGGSP